MRGLKQRFIDYCESEVRKTAAEDIARVILAAAPQCKAGCAENCRYCLRRDQAKKDAAIARRVGGVK